jgi:hypothetical protein
MSETPEKELKNIESMMFGGFIEPTPKNGIAWRVFDAVMGLRKERNKWRKCAEELAEALKELNTDFRIQSDGSYSKERIALENFERLKENE